MTVQGASLGYLVSKELDSLSVWDETALDEMRWDISLRRGAVREDEDQDKPKDEETQCLSEPK